jgi:hypothetical protein
MELYDFIKQNIKIEEYENVVEVSLIISHKDFFEYIYKEPPARVEPIYSVESPVFSIISKVLCYKNILFESERLWDIIIEKSIFNNIAENLIEFQVVLRRM